ncbi:MAG TPA: glycosyltransferase family 2 protein, partial [Ktedonobacteraceae bacterium]
IICAYTEERWHDLIAAIQSVQGSVFSPREIIVVIDHNAHLLQRLQQHYRAGGVIIIENNGPRGLSGARNSGISRAQGSIIAFLDDDAVATPDWLAMLTRGYADPQVIGTGGAVIPQWTGTKPGWFPEEFYWVVGCTYRGMPQTEMAIRNPIGANMSLRKAVCEMIGGFRSEMGRIGSRPVGCEETEFSIRAHQYWPQGTILYHAQAQVFHRVPPYRMTWRYFCARCYAEGVSKTVVSHFVGAKDGLASERSYIIKTLPEGVIRGLSDTFIHGDFSGMARAIAILVGLTLTTIGYIVGNITLRGSA